MKPRLVALVGPTASGKTALSIEAARRASVPVEIIVLDSRQLYRGLDIGTGKPDARQCDAVPHHLLDCLDPTETPDAMDYRRRVDSVARDILGRGAVPFLVGGAGFYLRALREGFHELQYDASTLEEIRARHRRLEDAELAARLEHVDPETFSRLHPNDRYRIGRALELWELSGRTASTLERQFVPRPVLGARFSVAVIDPPRDQLHERIARRTVEWLDGGWDEEFRRLLSDGLPPDAPGLQILGYRQVGAWIDGLVDRAGVENAIDTATRQYARAQSTWFRKEATEYRFEQPGEEAVAGLAELLETRAGAS